MASIGRNDTPDVERAPALRSAASGDSCALEGEFELPADLGRTLKKRIDEMDDKRRYVIASTFDAKQRHWLYYDVSSDSYVMGDLQRATAFKRRAIAEAVMALLRSEWHEIVECRRLSNGTLRLSKSKKAQ